MVVAVIEMAAEDEVVADYRSSLDDLKMNSKPLINMLTMLAEENKQFAAQFVEVIEERVLKVLLFLFAHPHTQRRLHKKAPTTML